MCIGKQDGEGKADDTVDVGRYDKKSMWEIEVYSVQVRVFRSREPDER